MKILKPSFVPSTTHYYFLYKSYIASYWIIYICNNHDRYVLLAFIVHSLILNIQLATYAQKYENITILTHSLDHTHHTPFIFWLRTHTLRLFYTPYALLYWLCLSHHQLSFACIMQLIMKICYAIILAWRRRKFSHHHFLTKHPLSHKVTRTYHTFWLTNVYYFWPSSHPSAWLCKFCYQAYRWIIFYCFHTLISLQARTIMPCDAENFRHVFHRCIMPWRKLPFLVFN